VGVWGKKNGIVEIKTTNETPTWYSQQPACPSARQKRADC